MKTILFICRGQDYLEYTFIFIPILQTNLELFSHLSHSDAFRYCVFDNGELVCCVNMDLHFILQVFRVNELKLGLRSKDLRCNRWKIAHCLLLLLTNLAQLKSNSAVISILNQIWPSQKKSTKVFVNSNSLT